MSLAAFLRLSRLKFLAAGLVGGAFGTAIAMYEGARFDAGTYAVAQLTITSFHLMTHYANDYFDRNSDAGGVRTPYSGGSGALLDGSLAPIVALRAALGCAALGMAGSLALATAGQRPTAALAGLAIGVGAWAYSAPPLRLCARGLGELDTALVVAALVPLCAFLAQGAPPDARLFGSVLPGVAAILAMMLAVEYPDATADAVGAKRNLVVRLGTRRARPLGIAFVVATFAAFGAALFLRAPLTYALVAPFLLPLGLSLGRAFAAWRDEAPLRPAQLAGRGVAFFFLVTFFGLLAYSIAPWIDGGATVVDAATVMGR